VKQFFEFFCIFCNREWRHDTRHGDILNNNTQDCGLYCDTQDNDTQHNGLSCVNKHDAFCITTLSILYLAITVNATAFSKMTLCIMLNVIMLDVIMLYVIMLDVIILYFIIQSLIIEHIITTLIIFTLGIMGLIMTLSQNDIQHNGIVSVKSYCIDECHFAECRGAQSLSLKSVLAQIF
jgi:hypothetical protein